MVNVAILGYGIVGSGVFELLTNNKDVINKNANDSVNLKYVLDIRDFEGQEIQKYITHNFDDIINDNSVNIIIEVMGGLNPSYKFVKEALSRGKHVVTSNKELVDAHGSELLLIAKNNKVNFLFEASVAGCIPIIRAIKESMTSDEIKELKGILNGTTNYILTEMSKNGCTFEQCLQSAKEKGYAEKDHSNDVDGFDTARKLAILLSLITGKSFNYKDITTTGISSVTKEDISFAKLAGASIKLLARSKKYNKKYAASVEPCVVSNDNPLYMVSDVYNAVLLDGKCTSQVMFYGKGAGKLPTATAVVSDIVNIINNIDKNIGYFWSSDKQKPLDVDLEDKYFVILDSHNIEILKNKVFEQFDDVQIYTHDDYKNSIAFITDKLTKDDLNNKLDKIKSDNNKVKSLYVFE